MKEGTAGENPSGRRGRDCNMRVLVVEDQRSLAEALRRGLSQEGHVVDVANEGTEGLDLAESGVHDAIILDVMLPGVDGMAIVRRLREEGASVPVLLLTARDALPDRLSGFNAGADDYLTKPFAFEELLARLRSITRRGNTPIDNEQLVVGDLVMDTRAREVMRAGIVIDLPLREYALLEYLMRHPGQALSRTVILDRVWEYGFDSFANVVDAAILRLRKAVDEGYDKQLIQTVRGVGYRIKA